MNEILNPRIGTFSFESPTQLPVRMKGRINRDIETIYQRTAVKKEVNFTMPQELHIVPLYENLLRLNLISYHNVHSSPPQFVHPHAFMLLDPDIGKYSATVNNQIVAPMQPLGLHEIQHWLELQDHEKNKWYQGYLSSALMVTKHPKDSTETIWYESIIHSRGEVDLNQARIAMAPTYPSRTDYTVMRNYHKTQIFSTDRNIFALIKKAREQGAKFGTGPISSETILNNIYKEWKENNKQKINMEYYKQYESENNIS